MRRCAPQSPLLASPAQRSDSRRTRAHAKVSRRTRLYNLRHRGPLRSTLVSPGHPRTASRASNPHHDHQCQLPYWRSERRRQRVLILLNLVQRVTPHHGILMLQAHVQTSRIHCQKYQPVHRVMISAIPARGLECFVSIFPQRILVSRFLSRGTCPAPRSRQSRLPLARLRRLVQGTRRLPHQEFGRALQLPRQCVWRSGRGRHMLAWWHLLVMPRRRRRRAQLAYPALPQVTSLLRRKRPKAVAASRNKYRRFPRTRHSQP